MERNNFIDVMKDLQGYFKPGERKAIYNNCDSVRDKLLIRILWKSGRRTSEILLLKVADINFEDRIILWNILKKKKPLKRLKPIDDYTLRFLRSYITRNNLKPTDYVFKSPVSNKPLSRQRVYQIVLRACEKAGIYNVGNTKPHPHHFRHTFAVNWAKNSNSPSDIKKLKDFLEHSSLNITETYLQFASEESRELVEADED